MPGTNLTRDEARTRASLLDVTSYSIDLDLTTGDSTFGSTTTIDFTCTQPGSDTFADLVGATVHEITLNGEAVDVAAYQDNRIALSGLAAENTLVVRADCTYSRTGEGLHRFVDPADDRVYLYSQFEVPDARRVYTTFEQPDLKAPFTFTRDRALPLGRRLQRAQPAARGPGRREVGLALPADQADVDVHHRPDRRRVPLGAPTPTTASSSEIPLGLYCRQSLVEHLDADELIKVTEQCFAFFEETFGYPYPFGKYDQLFVPEYNMGAMENAGVRHLPRRVPPPQPPGPRVLRVPRRGDRCTRWRTCGSATW